MAILSIQNMHKVVRLSKSYEDNLNQQFDWRAKLETCDNVDRAMIEDQIKAFASQLRKIDDEKSKLLLIMHPELFDQLATLKRTGKLA